MPLDSPDEGDDGDFERAEDVGQAVERLRRRDATAAGRLDAWLRALVLAQAGRILPVTAEIAEAWGRLGGPDPVPVVDGLLAATALEHGLTLVTRNAADVQRTGVPTLNRCAQKWRRRLAEVAPSGPAGYRPRVRPQVLLGVVLAVASCGAGDVFLPPPPDATMDDGVVLVVRAPGAPLRVLAASADAQPLLSLDVTSEGVVEIIALTYDDSLGALELPSGGLTAVPASQCGARALPKPAAVYQVRLDGGRAGQWRRLDAPPTDLDGFRFAGECPCHRFEVVDERLFPAEPRVVIPDPSGVRLVLGDGRVVRVDRDGGLVELATGARAAPSSVRSGVAGVGDEIWLSRSREVWRGSPSTGFVLTATVGGVGGLRSISGGVGASGFELFASTSEGYVLQLQPGPPRILSERPQGPSEADQFGLAAWVGPGEVFASEHNVLSVVHLRDGRVLGRAFLPENSRGAALLEHVPGVGVVVASPLSPLFTIEGLEAKALDAPTLEEPRALVPLEGGFVYTGDGGYLQEFQPGAGFCETLYLPGAPRYSHLFGFGDRLGLVGVGVDGSTRMLTLLDVLPAQDSP